MRANGEQLRGLARERGGRRSVSLTTVAVQDRRREGRKPFSQHGLLILVAFAQHHLEFHDAALKFWAPKIGSCSGYP